MFYYFGRKWTLAKHYPVPTHDTIIEPFAGSMGFSLFWKPETAIGIEADENVWNTWKYITDEGMTPEKILALPTPEIGEVVTNPWLMMCGVSERRAKATYYRWTARMSGLLSSMKKMAAANVEYARGIDYRLDVYKNAPDIEATWFIDPPYQRKIVGYNRIDLDYKELAEFCLTRKGQVIVCEQQGADWLPDFKFVKEISGNNDKRTVEVMWTNT